jgi:catechol 2,3-dioxygenase-like lactoylglutathione lyase family enzyme
MSVLGLREWFETRPGGSFNYGPDGDKGTQLFFYQAEEPGSYSRGQAGLHHVAFLVASREIVREAHRWACARDSTVLDEPREFPEYGPHCFATYWLDPHGIKLEAVCQSRRELLEPGVRSDVSRRRPPDRLRPPLRRQPVIESCSSYQVSRLGGVKSLSAL